jgi:ATP-dependent phosphoenolpyruvate carboxykinase
MKWASPSLRPPSHPASAGHSWSASEQIRRTACGKDAQAQCARLAREHGWGGGGYGTGKRIGLKNTRAIVDAIHSGALAKAKIERDPVFGFEIVTKVPGEPAEILRPRESWADKSAYDATATKLAGLFNKNLETYAIGASDEVKAAAPAA